MEIKFRKLFFLLLIGSMILSSSTVTACTGFTATKNNITLVGNNNDWRYPDTHIKVDPATNEEYGTFIIETKLKLPWNPDFINKCGGFNDQGLFYEKYNIYPKKIPIKSIYKKIFRPIYDLEYYCLKHCSNVEEVVEIYSKYNLFFMFSYQSFFVDKNGSSVIIEGDRLLYKKDDYQVVTNFLQSQTDNIECKRYLTAVEMLETMNNFTFEYFTSILNETYLNTHGFCTQNSQVYNLSSGEIYLYFHHKFDKFIKFNLTEELEKENHNYHIPSLFEDEENNPPTIPQAPKIHDKKFFNRKYKFYTIANDSDKDQMYYKWDYGDGTISDWDGPFDSNQVATNYDFHFYKEIGKYNIRVKSRDIYGMESNWSESLELKIGFINYLFKIIKTI